MRVINNRLMKVLDYEHIIEKTINALTHPGGLATDGECMDEVWVLLERKGYDLDYAKNERQKYYDTHGEKAYKKEYLS